MKPSDNQPHDRISFRDKIAARAEAQRQKNLSPQEKEFEAMKKEMIELRKKVHELDNYLNIMHFSGTLGITGTAKSGFIANTPAANVAVKGTAVCNDSGGVDIRITGSVNFS